MVVVAGAVGAVVATVVWVTAWGAEGDPVQPAARTARSIPAPRIAYMIGEIFVLMIILTG
jgi:hypothetical protein